MASYRSGIATKALFNHLNKHARLSRFLEQGARRAVLRASKDSVTGKAREIKSRFNVPHKHFSGVNQIKRKFRLNRRDTKAGPSIIERITGKPGIPMRDFGAQLSQGGGVKVVIRKGKVTRLKSAFFVREIGSHVFTREGSSRLPIEKRFGPGLPIMADQSAVRAAGLQRFDKRITKELRNEETRAFKRAGLA